MRVSTSLISTVAFIVVGALSRAEETAGIGAALAKKGDSLVVFAVVPDAAAARSHAVHVGDRVIAVAQEKGPTVSTKGMSISEAVRLIRGPAGTSVRLTLVPVGKDESQATVVELVRGVLKELARWGDGSLLATSTKAPDIEMVSLAGQKAERLAAYAGKVIVLEFWSTGCGPCQSVLANLQSHPEKYPAWKDQVILITLSTDESEEAAVKHLKEKGWNKTHNVRVGSEALKAYHVNALPTAYVIDQRGKVVAADHVVNIPEIVNRLIQ